MADWQNAPVVGGSWQDAPVVKTPTAGKLGDSGATWGAGDNFASGVWQGMGDEIKALTQATKAQFTGGPSFGKAYDQSKTAYQAARTKYQKENPAMAVATDISGQTAPWLAAAPLMPILGSTTLGRVGGAALTGGGSGAVSGALNAEGNVTDRAMGAMTGAGIGAAGGAAVSGGLEGIARIVRPNISPAVQTLLDEKVALTPGQVMGGAGQRVEDALTSLPFVGDAITNSQKRSIETFNRAVINRALDPIGKTLPMSMTSGREAVDYAGKAVSAAYEDLLPKLNLAVDPQFGQAINNLDQMAQSLEPNLSKQFTNILKTKVLDKFIGGQMSGETMKKIEGELGQFAKNYSTSALASERDLGAAVGEVQKALRGLTERSNPMYSGQLAKINNAFAQIARVDRAAGSLGAKDGTFTAAQYNSAVKAGDTSARKSRFARGTAMGQDISDAAMDVLPRKVPDSGTPLRTLVSLASLGGAGYAEPMSAVAGLGAAGMYTQPGQALMRLLMTSRPDQAASIAELIRRSAPAIAPAAAPMFIDGVR